MIENPDIGRQLANGRLERLRREADDHRRAKPPRGTRRRSRPLSAVATWFGRRRRPDATPSTAPA